MKAFCNADGRLVIDFEGETVEGDFKGPINENLILKDGVFIHTGQPYKLSHGLGEETK